MDAVSALVAVLEQIAPAHRWAALDDAIRRVEPGLPGVPFGSKLAEARDWARWASPPQREALALACFETLPPRRQADFLAHVTPDRRAAA